jgi:hypothetical protein
MEPSIVESFLDGVSQLEVERLLSLDQMPNKWLIT